MRFRALLRTSRTSCGTCGRASATTSSASASDTEDVGQQTPAGPAARPARRRGTREPGKPIRCSGGRRRRRTSRTRQRRGDARAAGGATDQRTASSSSPAARGAVPALQQIAGPRGVARGLVGQGGRSWRTSPGRHRPAPPGLGGAAPLGEARRQRPQQLRGGALAGGETVGLLQVVAERVGHGLVVPGDIAVRGPALGLDRVEPGERRGVRIGRRRGRRRRRRPARLGLGPPRPPPGREPRDRRRRRRAEQAQSTPRPGGESGSRMSRSGGLPAGSTEATSISAGSLATTPRWPVTTWTHGSPNAGSARLPGR